MANSIPDVPFPTGTPTECSEVECPLSLHLAGMRWQTPDKQARATELVLEQAEVLCGDCVEE